MIYVRHATWRLLRAPHGQERSPASRKLGKMLQIAKKRLTSATSQAMSCEPPLRVCRIVHIGTATEDIRK